MALSRTAAALALTITVIGIASGSQSARGQEAPPPEVELVPPVLLGEASIPYPPDRPLQLSTVVVTVKLLVDETGAVRSAERVTPPQPGYDEAVTAAALAFRFEPGRAGGAPVAVEVAFTHTFLPRPLPLPPPPLTESVPAPAQRSVLTGRLIERGTRREVAGAVVSARVEGEGDELVVPADVSGTFRLPVPNGEARITIKAPGYKTFLQRETLAAREELSVTYYLERERYDPYEIVVVDDERRAEVSRISLRGAEIKRVPGTFGDPFRVITALPGVATVMSLLPFPIVRGATPASTGLLLDGTRVPTLYHMLSGPSVIHPELIDEIEFYPGGAPVTYGGFVGGIVDGRTIRARADERLIDVDVNLLQSGALIRQPVAALGATMTAAARYGYPGAALSLIDSEISLSYWDYQVRLDGGSPRLAWTVFAFGARDELSSVPEFADPMDPNPPKEPQLILGFHRLDLRAGHKTGRFSGHYRVVGGADHTISAGADVSQLVIEPEASWRLDPIAALSLRAGVAGSVHHVTQGNSLSPLDEFSIRAITADIGSVGHGGAHLEALWRPTPRWLVRPGVRTDTWDDGKDRKSGVDPRLTVRYRLATADIEGVAAERDESGIWLKGALGVYHQPPRFVLPLPGLDIMPLRFGLLRSYQSSLGAEIPLSSTVSVTAEGFYNLLDRTVFDLALNEADINNAATTSIFPESSNPPPSEVDEILDRLITPQRGRSYGLELLVRRRVESGLFGWISYTLSRSERQRDGVYAPYDFDRAHLLNLVAGLPLPRNWDVSFRLQYNSGKAATTTSGTNRGRTDGSTRFDLRIDKRAVWNRWLLDFYVDITNIAVLPEEVTPGRTIRYVLPTVGVRGKF